MRQLPVFAIAPKMMIFLTVISFTIGGSPRETRDPYGRR
jgi:hypothetical protein